METWTIEQIEYWLHNYVLFDPDKDEPAENVNEALFVAMKKIKDPIDGIAAICKNTMRKKK